MNNNGCWTIIAFLHRWTVCGSLIDRFYCCLVNVPKIKDTDFHPCWGFVPEVLIKSIVFTSIGLRVLNFLTNTWHIYVPKMTTKHIFSTKWLFNHTYSIWNTKKDLGYLLHLQIFYLCSGIYRSTFELSWGNGIPFSQCCIKYYWCTV